MMKQPRKLWHIVGVVFILILAGTSFWYFQRVASMSPGLEIKALHKDGIDGAGISVAIIDQKLLTTHREYRDKLVYYHELGDMEGEPNSMHGPAVSSILSGKNCGVAPGANLYYWAVPVHGEGTGGDRYASGIRSVIDFNATLPEEEQIKVLSISTGFSHENGGDEFVVAIQEAQDAGIFVASSSYPYYTTPALAVYNAALQKGGSRDNINDYIVQPELVEYRGQTAEMIVSERHQRDDEMNYASVWVPVEPRLLASPSGSIWYELFATGGDSWATPYVAGVAALILQANPRLSNEQVTEIIANTAGENSNGLLMIVPKQAVLEARMLLK